MLTSKAFPPKLNVQVEPLKIPRLILLDGFNIMHHFKDLDHRDPNLKDTSMCPIVLVPFILTFANQGFCVRVVLKNMPPSNKVSHGYILKELEQLGLIIYDKDDDAEKCDLLMLKLAQKHGALIVTRNRLIDYTEFDEIAKRYWVEYDKYPGSFSLERLKHSLCFTSEFAIHDSESCFYACKDETDYELVKSSLTNFPPCPSSTTYTLNVLYLYLFNYFRYIYNLGNSKEIDFLEPRDEFPIRWPKFYILYNEHQHKVAMQDKVEVREEPFENEPFRFREEDCYISDDDEEEEEEAKDAVEAEKSLKRLDSGQKNTTLELSDDKAEEAKMIQESMEDPPYVFREEDCHLSDNEGEEEEEAKDVSVETGAEVDVIDVEELFKCCVTSDEKDSTLLQYVKNYTTDSASRHKNIIYVKNYANAVRVKNLLKRIKLDALILDGNRSRDEADNVMNTFLTDTSTLIAANIEKIVDEPCFQNLSNIIFYDAPNSPLQYKTRGQIHRLSPKTVFSIITVNDYGVYKDLLDENVSIGKDMPLLEDIVKLLSNMQLADEGDAI